MSVLALADSCLSDLRVKSRGKLGICAFIHMGTYIVEEGSSLA